VKLAHECDRENFDKRIIEAVSLAMVENCVADHDFDAANTALACLSQLGLTTTTDIQNKILKSLVATGNRNVVEVCGSLSCFRFFFFLLLLLLV
jgi:hypothetical protein